MGVVILLLYCCYLLLVEEVSIGVQCSLSRFGLPVSCAASHNPSSRGGSICLIYSTTTAAVLPVYPPIPSHIIYIAGWFGVGMGGWFSWVEMEVMATLLYTHKM